jgi:pimeloyl-ACP methyl ester carboxylesterase
MSRASLRGALAFALLLSGCKLLELRRNVETLDQMGLIGGKVAVVDPRGVPVIAVLVEGGGDDVVDEYVLAGPGAFFFSPLPGVYRVAAFEDRNRDFRYEPADEPAAWWGAPDSIELGRAGRVGDVDVRLPAEPGAPLGIAIALSPTARRGSKVLPPIATGDVVSLDDPRFDPKNGQLGLWQPIDFMFRVEAGFYFLEKYDPDKIPVLFVHGAGATPRDFAYLIAQLDRKRFQPWVMFYPTGLELDQIAASAARWLNLLRIRYEFERIAVVAHSMGGLVSRAMLNRFVASSGGRDELTVYVTLSTPWGGFASAESGVRNSPVVMPMWRSMAPDSAFLADLFAHPLPAPHYLLFSYQGRSFLLGDVASDGVVPVSSELPFRVQEQARKVYGFDHSHVGILHAPEVSALVNALLASEER